MFERLPRQQQADDTNRFAPSERGVRDGVDSGRPAPSPLADVGAAGTDRQAVLDGAEQAHEAAQRAVVGERLGAHGEHAVGEHALQRQRDRRDGQVSPEKVPLEEDVAPGGGGLRMRAVELDEAAEPVAEADAEVTPAGAGHGLLVGDEGIEVGGGEVVGDAATERLDPLPDARPGPGGERLD